MKKYKQLSEEERRTMYKLLKDKESLTKIAKKLSRNKSTICREKRRNTVNNFLGYLPDTAEKMAKQRKAKHKPKMERYKSLKIYVVEHLNMKWSPEMIAGRLKKEKRDQQISHEAIYQFVYSSTGKALGLYKTLCRGRVKRSAFYGRKHRNNDYGIPGRVSIHQRPSLIDKCKEFGHYEGDLTFFKSSQSVNLSVLVEKKTRFLFLAKNVSKKTQIVLNGIEKIIDTCGAQNIFKSITFDNGKEFASHSRLKQKKIDTYFCDPGAPWQKGQVEGSIAILHRFLPKESNLGHLSEEKLREIQTFFNDLPRKCLNFMTPAEVFYSNINVVALRT